MTKKVKSTAQMSCLIYGASGRMGLQLIHAMKNHPSLNLASSVDEREIKAFDAKHTAVLKFSEKALAAVLQGVDIVIDFSSPKGTSSLTKALEYATGKVVLVGTTGLDNKQRSALFKAAHNGRHKLLLAGNTSLGVATMAKLAKVAVSTLSPAGFDIEIVETHHARKADAPSGTAIFLAKVVEQTNPKLKVIFERKGKREKNTVCIHAIRGGGVVGEHSIRFISDLEEVSISHRAFDRTLFAEGALHLVAEIAKNMKPGEAKELVDYLDS